MTVFSLIPPPLSARRVGGGVRGSCELLGRPMIKSIHRQPRRGVTVTWSLKPLAHDQHVASLLVCVPRSGCFFFERKRRVADRLPFMFIPSRTLHQSGRQRIHFSSVDFWVPMAFRVPPLDHPPRFFFFFKEGESTQCTRTFKVV